MFATKDKIKMIKLLRWFFKDMGLVHAKEIVDAFINLYEDALQLTAVEDERLYLQNHEEELKFQLILVARAVENDEYEIENGKLFIVERSPVFYTRLTKLSSGEF